MMFTITYYDAEDYGNHCAIQEANTAQDAVNLVERLFKDPNECKITGVFAGNLDNLYPNRLTAEAMTSPRDHLRLKDYCDECGASYPTEAKDMSGPWHAVSCSLYEAPAGNGSQLDLQFESLGSVSVVQPLTKKGMDWVRHKLAFEQWQVVGGTGVAVEARTVDDLRQNAVDDGLVVK
jgi:hypothetical protein